MVAGTDASTQALLEIAMAAALLKAGRVHEAERDARSAVEYFATTDMITFHGNSAMILGDVLRAAGRRAEADAAFQTALDLYGQKGSLVSVELPQLGSRADESHEGPVRSRLRARTLTY